MQKLGIYYGTSMGLVPKQLPPHQSTWQRYWYCIISAYCNCPRGLWSTILSTWKVGKKNNYRIHKTHPSKCLPNGKSKRESSKNERAKWARNFSDVHRYTVYMRQQNENHRNSVDVSLCATRRKILIQRRGPGYLGRDISYLPNSAAGSGDILF